MTTEHELHIAPHGEREIRMTRTFDAPRELVYEAYTKPEYLRRWLGVFNGWELAVCEMDVREGGAYRWVWRNSTRPKDMGVSGMFREINAPDRIVFTEKFDDAWYKGEALNTVNFVEKHGKTTLLMICRYESTEVRDLVLKTDMEKGLRASYDKLAWVLATR